VSPEEWVEILRREYLADYVREGGSSVKFVVAAQPSIRKSVQDGIVRTARAEAFEVVTLDAITTKLHLMQKFFYAVAKRTEWEDLAHAFMKRSLEQLGCSIATTGHFDLDELAGRGASGRDSLLEKLAAILKKDVYDDHAMTHEFRVGMMQLCLAQIKYGDRMGSYYAAVVKDWLCGELHLVSALKEALIFEKIQKHNARHMLFSLAHWLRKNSASGLVIVLDIDRYLTTAKMRERDSGFYYSYGMVLDLYELLRQFIDDLAELEGVMVVVIAPEAFLKDERRSIERYQALKMRIWDDVRVRQLQNPFSPLVRF